MPRFVSYLVTLVAVIALFSSGGYVLARWSELDSLVMIMGYTLEYSLYILAFCAAYAIFVGVYHTFLSVTGLDE